MGYEYKSPEIEVILFRSQDVMSSSQQTSTIPSSTTSTTQQIIESGWTGYY